ncbi:MAG TPA: response regulator [Anaeromyxobacteraceae bacterium]|nr:response regulator [Anaeromyxobacteraceae bacterium]
MTPRRILLVDDNDALVENLADLLQTEGYEVATAADGAEALTRLAADPLPHVVLLDLNLPRVGGREIAERIRRDPRLSSVRVVLSSGLPSAQIRATVPANAFLAKPFGLKDLLATLDEVFEGAAA